MIISCVACDLGLSGNPDILFVACSGYDIHVNLILILILQLILKISVLQLRLVLVCFVLFKYLKLRTPP